MKKKLTKKEKGEKKELNSSLPNFYSFVCTLKDLNFSDFEIIFSNIIYYGDIICDLTFTF